jgi:hypothetical protein
MAADYGRADPLRVATFRLKSTGLSLAKSLQLRFFRPQGDRFAWRLRSTRWRMYEF